MYIAITADGKSLTSNVADDFTLCKHLLIVNMDTMEVTSLENLGDPQGEVLSRKILAYNCEAVISGRLTPEAFEIIADGDITRYDGHGHSAKDALVLMEKQELKLIRTPEGSDECGSRHADDPCNEHGE